MLVERVLGGDGGFNPQKLVELHIPIHEYGEPGVRRHEHLSALLCRREDTRRLGHDFQGEIPDHCEPPYDRDRHLPSSYQFRGVGP